jgi:hypothetical protein
VTFQVMRRSLGTHLQGHGTLKDTQGALRHASIATTGNLYVQVVEESVMRQSTLTPQQCSMAGGRRLRNLG